MSSRTAEEVIARIDREESIAIAKISVILPPDLHIAVMQALDPLSEAIQDAAEWASEEPTNEQ